MTQSIQTCMNKTDKGGGKSKQFDKYVSSGKKKMINEQICKNLFLK